MSEKIYTIQGMDCAGCARELEDGVGRLDGVERVQVDFTTSLMRLNGDVPFEVLKTRVEALGKSIADQSAERPAPAVPRRGGIAGFWDYLQKSTETRLALAGGGLALVTLALSLIFTLPENITAVAYIVAMLLPLYPIARSGLNNLRINRAANINLLMTVAALGAIWIGEYLEGATVIFLFALGEALEGYTADRARDSIRGLMNLKPREAIRVLGDMQETVPVETLCVGDVIVVRPGDNIPMDGDVLSGSSSVNQAPITGESVPVDKSAGDGVFAGTINGTGALTIRVTHLAEDNTLSRIIHLVEQAQSERAPTQRLINRFAEVYTPAVMVLAALIAVVPPLLFGQPFYDTAEAHGWLYRALSMLVIACPCALVISTPVTIISAITAAARRGVLIKGGAHLEALGKVKAIAFDKTGTLTAGTPVVTSWRAFACATGEPCADCDDVLALAASVELGISHPLAQAVVRQAQASGLAAHYAPAAAVVAEAGRGATGTVGGHAVALGSHRHFDQAYPHEASVCARAWEAERDGQTVMLVAQDTAVRGMITLADSLRLESSDVVTALKGMGLKTVMMTGDNQTVASAISRPLKLDMVYSDLLPQHKLRHLRDLMRDYGSVAMVGDGINDTPALAAATVGIAMGGAGSPQALETADVALMADDLRQLPYAIRLARFARRLIMENVALSFGIKALFLVLAFFGFTSLWVAILADVGMSLLVTLNGMRPLRFEKQTTA